MAETNINIRLKKFLSSALNAIHNKNYDEAVRKLRQALSLDPENPEILYNLGIASCRQERYVEAIDYFRRLLELKSTSVDILQVLRLISFSLIKLGLFDDALLYSTRGLDFQSDDTVLLHLAAYALDASAKHDEAMEYYRIILEIDPENISAKNSLAYLIAKTGGDLKKAGRLAKDAVKADSNNPAYLDTLGFVMFRMGDLGSAMKYLQKALALAPKSKEILYHIAMVKKATNPDKEL